MKDLTDFRSYLKKILENISQEQKPIFQFGDLNASFFNYNDHNQINEFLYYLVYNSFIPLTLQPSRIISYSEYSYR